MIEALRLADFRFIILGALVSLIWLVVRALAWKALVADRATLSQTFLTINEGYLLNNFLPFRLGEVARAFLLGNKTGLGFWQVFPTVVIERFMDLGMAVGLLLVSAIFVVGGSWAREAAIAAGIIVALGFVVLYLLARYQDRAIAIINRLTRLHPVLERLSNRVVPPFLAGLTALTDTRLFLRALFWIAVDWFLAFVQYYFIMRAFFPEVQPLWAAFTLGVAAIGIAAPSSPGALGVLELSIVGALSVFGVDPSAGLAYALSTHAVQYLLTGVLGAYGLVRDGESFIGLYQRVRQIPNSANQ